MRPKSSPNSPLRWGMRPDRSWIMIPTIHAALPKRNRGRRPTPRTRRRQATVGPRRSSLWLAVGSADVLRYTGARVRVRLQEFVRDAGKAQIDAWDESIPWLQRECRELVGAYDAARSYTAILEYELPRESRRPDVIVLENGVVVVLELKGKDVPSQADIDQVFCYARDLRSYHAECADRPVHAVLVPTRAGPAHREIDGVN